MISPRRVQVRATSRYTAMARQEFNESLLDINFAVQIALRNWNMFSHGRLKFYVFGSHSVI